MRVFQSLFEQQRDKQAFDPILPRWMAGPLLAFWSWCVGAYKSGRQQTQLRALQIENAELRASNAELKRLAHTDCLTKLLNRRAFLQAAQHELARMRRSGHSACVVLGDIDHFKQFNDLCGHAAGDRVLQAVAATLRACIRTTDVIARWGGEELIILLPETELAGAAIAAEKSRQAVASCGFACRDHAVALSITMGVSLISPEEDIELAIARADAALYLGKRRGRNQVTLATDLTDRLFERCSDN